MPSPTSYQPIPDHLDSAMASKAYKVFCNKFRSIQKSIRSTYASEAHHQAIIFYNLVQGGVSPSRILVDSYWRTEPLNDAYAPAKKTSSRIDIVVLSGKPSSAWCGVPAFGPEDFRKAELAIEIKRCTTNYPAMRRDMERLVTIRDVSTGSATRVAMLLIDDKLHMIGKKRDQVENAIRKALDFAEAVQIPVHLVRMRPKWQRRG